MKKEIVIIEIKDGQALKDWGKEITERMDEARAAVRLEQIVREQTSYFEVGDRKFVLFYTEGNPIPADNTIPINKKHREVMDAIRLERIKLEPVYDIEIKDRDS